MLAFFKDNFALYLSILLLAVGLGFQGAFIAPIGSNVGIENSLLNYVMNAYYIGFLAGVYIVPKLIDKVNYVRSFAILGTTFSAIFIGFALFQDFPSWLVLRVLSGVCFSGLYLITESWINSSIENDNRGNAISLYLVFMFVGILFGNYIIRFADHNGLQILAMMSFMLSLSFIPVLLMRYEPQKLEKNEKISLTELYQTSPMGSVGMLLVGCGYSLIVMLSIYVSGELNATTTQISNFLMLGAILSLPSTYLIGKLSDKIDRRIVILSLSGAALLGAILFGSQSEMSFFIYLSYIILSVALNPLYSICIAQTNDWLSKEKRVAAAAKLGLLYGIGSIIGGLATSTMIMIFGSSVLVTMQIALYGTLILFTTYRYIIGRQSETTAKFIPMPNRASMVSLDIHKSGKKKSKQK